MRCSTEVLWEALGGTGYSDDGTVAVLLAHGCGENAYFRDEGTQMDGQFDLFEMENGAFPKWVGAAANLEQAIRRLENLVRVQAGAEYFVRDFCSGSVVAFAGRSDNREVSRVN
jgi:hypothetical protein